MSDVSVYTYMYKAVYVGRGGVGGLMSFYCSFRMRKNLPLIVYDKEHVHILSVNCLLSFVPGPISLSVCGRKEHVGDQTMDIWRLRLCATNMQNETMWIHDSLKMWFKILPLETAMKFPIYTLYACLHMCCV